MDISILLGTYYLQYVYALFIKKQIRYFCENMFFSTVCRVPLAKYFYLPKSSVGDLDPDAVGSEIIFRIRIGIINFGSVFNKLLFSVTKIA